MSMNRTKIDWCEKSWNPVVGCYHNCPYCYARNMAARFGGFDGYGCEEDFANEMANARSLLRTLHDLKEPAYIRRGEERKIFKAAFPFGFEPTILRYRLDEPKRMKKPSTIFVGSMTDLFGEWVPLRWIRDVLDACLATPKHRYLFLTKNPKRYDSLETMALLPTGDRFWYGATVTKTEDFANIPIMAPWYHQFLSIEPLLDRVDMNQVTGCQRWIIIGAETGKRANKVIPRREWVDEITEYCAICEIPVFYKDSLRKLFSDLPESRLPWDMGTSGKNVVTFGMGEDGKQKIHEIVADTCDDREGICPVCGEAITYTGSHEIDDSGGTILWICANCGASGKEGYNRVFDRHYAVMDRDGNLIPGRPE